MTNDTQSANRAAEIFTQDRQAIFARTDRVFAWLLFAEWIGGIITALVISPRTWIGTNSQTHLHVWAALFLGGLIVGLPIFLALRRPGAEITRHSIAVAQLLMSGLLIHFSGGRVETHFHIFGSLALLAMYRDWRVIVTATVVTALDHVIRGVFFPQSIYGVLTASPFRWIEHAAWVIFEDFFLIPSCFQTQQEMQNLAQQRAHLEASDRASQRQVVELKESEERTRTLGVQIEQEKNQATTFINQTMMILERLAARDLTVRMEENLQGDYGRIKTALNKAVDNLCQTLAQVSASATQLTVASGQISAGSQALAQGASEQASAFEEVSANLQEMAAVTQQNTSNAKKACDISSGARAITDKGVSSMERLSDAIVKIKASADSTAKIVKTIDEIAFQTNLLALNAAVEAARAGDAGKGFAVVADEVRNLAMRSAEAAKNTATLIEESVKNAEDGVSLNQEALHNLEEISAQVQQVSDVMNEIAATSNHQSHGVQQINSAIETMSQVTQLTAANAEESSAAAEELRGQADEMENMVATFKLETALTTSPFPAQTFRPQAKKFAPPQTIKIAKAAPNSTPAARSSQSAPKPQDVIPFDDEFDSDALQEF